MKLGLEEWNTYAFKFFEHPQLHHGKEAPFVIKVMEKVVIIVKFFVKVPYLVYVRNTNQPCQICPSLRRKYSGGNDPGIGIRSHQLVR